MASPLIRAQVFLYLIILQTTAAASAFPISRPGCPDKCGDITIPYPFGTRSGCYRPGFKITCNNSFTPPKPIVGINVPLLEIDITRAEARVLNLIGYDCYKNNMTKESSVDRSKPFHYYPPDKAFLFSNQRNKFTVIGCRTFAYISGMQGNYSYWSGCMSFCESLNKTTGNGGPCDGFGCCQTAIPEGLNSYKVRWGFNSSYAWEFNPCSYAALMQEDWYKFTVKDLEGFEFSNKNKKHVPIVLDWAIRGTGKCLGNVESSSKPACLSKYSGCNNTVNGEGYICKCLPGYEGNPYLENGCTGNYFNMDKLRFLVRLDRARISVRIAIFELVVENSANSRNSRIELTLTIPD